MSAPARFAMLRRLFEEVCDLPVDERRAHLAKSGADTALAAEVEALISSETRELKRVVAPVAALLHAMPETELGVGERIGAWRLVERLASGGMGAVYLAERADGHFTQQAAIKLLRGFPTADALARLAAERQMLAGLQHPHIARLIDGGATPGGQPYLVMEYVDGVQIDRSCRERGLDLPARLRLFRNVCRAVAFAHQRLIVHCDLKPSNVLVRADGAPVLLDFGIARALDLSREGAPGDAFFTPGYASPEQIDGAAVTVASDVYSLGLILFELVTGRKARLDAEDLTVTQLGRAERRPSELVAAGIPWRRALAGDLDAIVLRATAERPALRYASADALAEDVERFLDRKTVSARPQTFLYRYGRLVRRRWPLFAAGFAICTILALSSWRIVNERDRALAAEREAKVQAATAEQVSEFLSSVFEFANPEKNPQRRDVSAREMLDEGTRRIDATLADQPAVRARLYEVLGRAWEMLGQPERSIALYRQAADLWGSSGLARPDARADALSRAAVVLTNNDRDDEALVLAREALAIREAQVPPVEAELADSWNTLALVEVGLSQFDAAERDFERALDVRRRLGNEGSIAATLHNLGILYRERGEVDRAVEAFDRALAIKRRLHGSDKHPNVLITLENAAKNLSRNGRPTEAIPVLEHILAARREQDGFESRNVSLGHNELGSVLHDAGRFRDAAAHYREAMRIDLALGGPEDAAAARPLNNLASAFEDMGDYAAAEPLFRRSLAMRAASKTPNAVIIARAQANLARALLARGELAESKTLLDAALATRREKLGDGNIETVKSMLQLADWLRRSERYDEARRQIDATTETGAPLTPLFKAQRLQLLARIKRHGGDAAGGLADTVAAQEFMVTGWGERHPLTAAFMLDRAEAEFGAGNVPEASHWLDLAAPVLKEALAPVAPDLKRVAQLRDLISGSRRASR
jgi:serine/threonine-protein kinase